MNGFVLEDFHKTPKEFWVMFSYYFIFKNKINDKKITFMERSY